MEVVAIIGGEAVAAVAVGVVGLFLFHQFVETTMRYIFTFVSCQSGYSASDCALKGQAVNMSHNYTFTCLMIP